MPDTIIQVENLGKKYLLRHKTKERYVALRDVIAKNMASIALKLSTSKNKIKPNPTREEFWALKNVSFNVKYGEVTGIIGRNGAGKSTLLKIISRITAPSEGSLKLKGRVASLLEVGTGFHPELTGRENIFLNGAILGMTNKEIKRKFDEIVSFAETDKFLDTPVKRYSSGMYVRLAFAVAAHLEPEILLIDEVLAVGDLAFQRKCLGKMNEVSNQGRTVLFVSHNLAAITSLCDRVVHIDKGKIKNHGNPQAVVEDYINDSTDEKNYCDLSNKRREGNGDLIFTEIRILNNNMQTIKSAYSGQDVILSLKYTSKRKQPLKNVSVLIGFKNILGHFLFMCGNEMAGQSFASISSTGQINCMIKKLPLSSGVYKFNFNCKVNGIMADYITDHFQLNVVDGDFYGTGYLPPKSHGGFLVEQHWELL